MADKTSKYTVKLMHNFEYDTRWRCGTQFGRGEVKVLDLTPEQVQEFKNDRYFEVKKGARKVESANVAEGEAVLQPTEAGEENAGSTPGVTENTTVVEEEEVSGALAELLQNSRAVLDAKATELGVEAPEALPNKTAVAEAIIAKRG